MTDVALRDTEREAGLGDMAAEVRLLVARRRAGFLDSADLELAAYCGHRPSQLALGWTPPTARAFVVPGHLVGSPANWWAIDLLDEWNDESLVTWLTGLKHHPRRQLVRVRAGLAAAEVVDPFHAPDSTDRANTSVGFYHPNRYNTTVVACAMRAMYDWLACPCDTHRAGARHFLPKFTPEGCRWWTHVLTIICLEEIGHRDLSGQQSNSHEAWLQNAVLESARYGGGSDKVRRAIQQALITWSLTNDHEA